MEVKIRFMVTSKLINEFVPSIQDLVHYVIYARLIDYCLDGIMDIETQDRLDNVLEEMAENISKAEENEKKLSDFLKNSKNCDKEVLNLMIYFLKSLSVALKLSCESIKLQLFLKKENLNDEV